MLTKAVRDYWFSVNETRYLIPLYLMIPRRDNRSSTRKTPLTNFFNMLSDKLVETFK
jgi:hypothetical protein